ncbi:hypothetical protein DFH29DRAFT_258534 [Suillus ampliporus]|nr:hypothetical protein DFH29DRAFT_258534 [Suillus ampliporus]
MAAEPEPAVVEDACEPIGAEASPTEVDISSAGEEPAVIETVNPASIESAAEATPEGEYIPVEPELALVEAESVPVETHNSPAEPESTPPTLEAAPIDSTLGEVIVEETPAVSEPDAQPAATLEPTTKVAEPEPLEDTAGAVEPIAEAAESGPAEEIAPVAEAVVPVETSGAEAEESAAEVDAPVASEEEPNEAPQGAIEAENKPAPPTELEVDAFVPELVFIPTEAATEPVVSTEPEEAVIALNMEPEVPVESLIAAEGESVTADDSITADSNPVTVPDPEPVATTETDPVAVAEPEPAAIEPEAPTALDPEPTEPEAESTVVETFPIDVEPPSSNASFVEDPEVNFTYDDEPQTPVAKETPAFEAASFGR